MQTRRVTSLCGWCVIFLCLIVLVGWQFDIQALKGILPFAPTTTPLTAIWLGILGTSLLLAEKAKNTSHPKNTIWISRIFASVTLLTTLWIGLKYIFNLGPDIELLIFKEQSLRAQPEFPGRPSPRTVINCILISTAILTVSGTGKNSVRTTNLLAISGMIIPWIALIGYAALSHNFYSFSPASGVGMSPVTLIGFLLLSIGIISLHPTVGILGLLQSNTSGGTLTRLLLPVIIIAPLFVSWFVGYNFHVKWISPLSTIISGFGLISFLTTILVLSGAAMINKKEEEKEILLSKVTESEANYHQLINDVEDYAIIRLDVEGRIQVWNKGAERITKYSEEDAISKSFSLLFTEEDRQQHKPEELLQKVKREGRIKSEGWRSRKDGTLFWVNDVLTALYDDKENIVGLANVIQDLTQQKSYEDSIETLNMNLAQSNKELESFSYSVSHDLRAPLRAISGFSNVLIEKQGDKLDEEGKRITEIIIRNTKRMGQLIDDILNFSKITRKSISLSKINLSELFLNTFKSQLLFEDKNRKIDFHIEELPDVMGDNSMIRQVVVNLVSNALKYTRSKEHAYIEVGVEKKYNEQIIFIKDNGAGFDMQYYSKLFAVFQRLHREEEFEGTGVGLAFVKRILEKHNGRIWAESKVNEGTTFFFTLPGTTESVKLFKKLS